MARRLFQWLITVIKANHFVWPLPQADYCNNSAERQLLTPVKRTEGPKLYVCFCRPPFLIPSRIFYIWAPHGPKFLHVNLTQSCSAFQDLPGTRIFLPPSKQPSSFTGKFWNPVPPIRNPRRRIQNPRLSQIPSAQHESFVCGSHSLSLSHFGILSSSVTFKYMFHELPFSVLLCS